MEKIRVVHHANQLGLGGTEKTMQLFCKYMDKNIFDVHVLTRKDPAPLTEIWMTNIKALLGRGKYKAKKSQFEQAFRRAPEFKELLGPDNVHFYTLSSLPEIIAKISPLILHVHNSGIIEPPLDQPHAISQIPAIFTTNIFGKQGRSPEQEKISKILFVSNWLKEYASWSKGDSRCDVLYNPIEKPLTDTNLRSELNISEDVFVIGRVGRNAYDIYDPISIKAYKEIENKKTLFLVLSPPLQMVKDAKEIGIRNILFLEPSTNDLFLSRFYNTIDIFAHARLDGETFGCAIAEAMIHGKPVVSHQSGIYNAQTEIIDDSCGFIADKDDFTAYAAFLKRLFENRELREQMGAAARKKALMNFEAGVVTKKLETLYLDELRKKGNRTEIGQTRPQAT